MLMMELIGSVVGDYLLICMGLAVLLITIVGMCTNEEFRIDGVGMGFIVGFGIFMFGCVDLTEAQLIKVVQDKIGYVQKNNMDMEFLNKNFLLLKQGWLADGGKTYDCKVYQDEQKRYYLLLRKEENKVLPIEIYKQSSIEGKNMLAAVKGSILQ